MELTFNFYARLALGAGFVVACCTLAQAQDDRYYAKGGEARRGYWKLTTDADTRGTLVRFYDADSQLVYHETLPNQFVRLTPANLRRLDQTLARLVSNRLVASSIETSELPQDTRSPKRTANAGLPPDAMPPTPAKSAASGLAVSFLHPGSGKPGVLLYMNNPAHEKVTISIRSEENILYEQVSRMATERIFLNMSGMPAGNYEVHVVGQTIKARQKVHIDYNARTSVDWP
jgi:hypothetical protein